MKLYFLRHATAVDEATTDAARELTNEGKQEARILGAALRKLGVKPDRILTSPLVRAEQTAQIVAKAMRFRKKVEIANALKNEAGSAALIRALKSCQLDERIFLAGHEPSLSEHIARLIGARNAAGMPLDKGGAAYVEIPAWGAQGQLKWLMRQKQLRLIAH
ncbi:MAG: phosphohistidine phosphatase SixA [Verrucomicrobia bacterium]|nr:phosphohistidine phosphatase SixA [Verrucomicrobiota bacterium]